MKIGDRIREARQAQGLTQARLAEALGCTVGYVAHIECSRSIPSEPKLLQLGEILHLDKRDLIRQRQREKASKEAQPFYEDAGDELTFFRDAHLLSPEQVAYALKVIRAVESNAKVRTAIDLLIGED